MLENMQVSCVNIEEIRLKLVLLLKHSDLCNEKKGKTEVERRNLR